MPEPAAPTARRDVTDPTARLIASTRRRLVGVTFGLVAILVVGVGAITAIAGLRALDADVDRALDAAVAVAAKHAGEQVPESTDGDETTPASADTFVMYLDTGGHLTANPSRVRLAGLPDQAAVTAVRGATNRDLRTVTAGGLSVRLLTVRLAAEDGATGYVQGGFVLTLHDRQSASILVTIVIVGLAGLLAAALVTLVVTSRALVPVRRSFEAQRRFVADASHELRTPVALIRANAEVLQREGLVGPAGAPLTADIVAEADRLGRLVGDLLTIAASDARGLAVDLVPLDLAGLATETVRGAGALADERGVSIAVDADRPVRVAGDRDRLIQLVLILVDNAISHSPVGGVVTVGVATRDGRATLTVADQGPGIPPPDREKIFEAFTRLRDGGRRGHHGSGLGLAIGSRIAAAHGGEIGVDEAPGGGARFTVSLPLARQAG